MRFALLHALVALVLATLAAGFTACGDDDSVQTGAPAVTDAMGADEGSAPGVASPEDDPAADPAADHEAIRVTLVSLLTDADPRQACVELVTERYVSRSYGDEAGCRAAQADQRTARRVRVERIVVTPEASAQASAEPRGGIYDGQTLRAELVLTEGVWKVDSLRSNVPVGP